MWTTWSFHTGDRVVYGVVLQRVVKVVPVVLGVFTTLWVNPAYSL